MAVLPADEYPIIRRPKWRRVVLKRIIVTPFAIDVKLELVITCDFRKMIHLLFLRKNNNNNNEENPPPTYTLKRREKG